MAGLGSLQATGSGVALLPDTVTHFQPAALTWVKGCGFSSWLDFFFKRGLENLPQVA
jgi:hypothetical protein